MNNFQQAGDTITLTAPSGGVVTGLGYKIGNLFVVATATVAETLPFEAQVTGVVELVKDAGTSWTEGELLYWDDSASNVVDASGSTAGKLLIGCAAAAADSGAVLGDVRLNAVARPLGVSDNELDDDAVDTAAIQDDAVTNAKIGPLAVDTGELAADAVTGAKIEDDAVDSEHYTDGSVDRVHLGVGSGVLVGEELGQPSALDDNYFLISTVMKATAYTLDQTALPANNPPRNIIVTHTADGNVDTLGNMVVDGTDVDDGVIQETIAIANGTTAVGTKAFKTVTACTSASWVADGNADTIEIGFDTLLGLDRVHSATSEIFQAQLAGLVRLPDAVVIDAVDVEENTISLTGGTYDGSKVAKVIIKL